MEVTCANDLCRRSFVFKGGKVHFNRNKRHYCSVSCISVRHGLAGTARHRLWASARKRSREDGTMFSLSVHDIPDMPEKCPVLGIILAANSKSGPLDSSPSLDRIRPVLGYVPGNVRIISNRANRIRSDASSEELFKIAQDAALLEKSNG